MTTETKGQKKTLCKYLLFVDSDIEFTENTKIFLEENINRINENKIYWGLYSTSENTNIFQKIQIQY